MFALDSKFYRFATELYKIVVLNLLFALVSLPLITIPTAFSALIGGLADEKTVAIIAPFFKRLRQNIVRTIPLGIFNLFSILFIRSLGQMMGDSLLMKLFFWLFCGFLLIYNLNLYYVQKEEIDTKGFYRLYQETFFLSIVRFYRQLLTLLLLGTFYWLTYTYCPVLMQLLGIAAPMYFYQATFAGAPTMDKQLSVRDGQR